MAIKKHFVLNVVLSILAYGCAIVPTLAQGQAKAKVDKVDETYAVMKPLMADPLYVQLDSDQALWKQSPYSSITVPDEAPGHPQGIFWLSGIGVSPPIGQPPNLYSFGQSHIRVIDARQVVSEAQCRQNGLTFLQRQFPEVFAKTSPLQVRSRQPNWRSTDSKGVWTFDWWWSNEEGLAQMRVTALVRVADGKVVGFSINPTDNKLWPRHKVPFAEIKSSIIRLLEQSRKVENLVMGPVTVFESKWLYGQRKVPPTLFNVEVSARDEATKDAVEATLPVDADTGNPVWIEHGTGEPTDHEPQWHSVAGGDWDVAESPDKFTATPLWINQKLIYVATCRSEGMPDWVPVSSQVVLSGKMGVQQITQDLEVTSHALYGLPNSSWFGLERQGWTYAINIQTGDYRVLGTPEHNSETPTISPDGEWAVVSGTGHLGSADADLFADNLERGHALQRRVRIVISHSEDVLPLFSPDGKWLYFVSAVGNADKGSLILRRIPAELIHAKDLVRLKPEQITDVMALPLEDIRRLSVFPNGQKLLLQSVRVSRPPQMFVLDLATRKATLLKLPSLKDAELNGAPITRLEDGWAGPSDNEVTFSGETTDAAKVVRRRIYSCRLDGSGLKALTPKDNTPVPAYTFPQSKKSATDIAVEWALREVAWDKAHRGR